MRGGEPAADRPAAESFARLRRLRRTESLRSVFAERDLESRRLVLPVFVGSPRRGTPPSRPPQGIEAPSPGGIERLARGLAKDGVRSVLLFGVAARKHPDGREAWNENGPVPEALRAFRRAAPELVLATDVCLCAYTAHGHCGRLTPDGAVDNDATLDALERVAVAHARAGADLVAPSAMMDGQVLRIRTALDRAGFGGTGILAYATKHASAFYGPFREWEGSAPRHGDRKGYQLDWRNAREAMRELREDVREGADVLMVKPAITSLDLLARARALVDLPLAAFQVSGEWAMIKAAARQGWLDERQAVRETLGAVHRAGADLIVTYFARDVARSEGAPR